MNGTGSVAPPMGAIFELENQRYRVTGWLKPAARTARGHGFGSVLDSLVFESHAQCGRNGERLVFCDRGEAVYVCGSGGCGVIAGIDEIRVVGMVDWRPAEIAREENDYRAMIGEMVF